MSDARYLLAVDARGVATVTLNRPEVANAYDEDLLRALTAGLERLGADSAVRAVVIRGAGKHFQAGADLNWLNRLSRQGPEENYEASIITVQYRQVLNELPESRTSLRWCNGAVFAGGGCGVACLCRYRTGDMVFVPAISECGSRMPSTCSSGE